MVLQVFTCLVLASPMVWSAQVVLEESYCELNDGACSGLDLEATILRHEAPDWLPRQEFLAAGSYLNSYTASIKNEECKQQVATFVAALSNSSLWAVQMLDSSSKIPSGLISANTYQLGDFDQCLKVNAGGLRGKYCLADVRFAPTATKHPPFYRQHLENAFSLHYDPYGSVWEKFIPTEDPSKHRRDLFHSGVCAPHACPASDIEAVLHLVTADMAARYGIMVNITVAEGSCATSEPRPFTTGARVLSCILAFFVVSVIIFTAWDLTRDRSKELSRLGQLMESFSINRTVARLSTPDPSAEMDVFHGMKTLSMLLIIMGHRCVSTYGGPFFNPEFLEERYRKYQDMLLLNGTLIVDTFFLIGGYITFLALFREYEAGKRVQASKVYLYRWLRITPVYMLVVFFYGYLLEHLGDGPVWNQRVGREAERCRDNWWTNFLYINNYVNTDRLCMFQSWYVTCDMHFILLAPLVARWLARTPRKGVLILSSLLVVSVAVPFTITYWYRFDGVLRVYMSIFQDLASNPMFSHVYIRTHNRATPYLIGMAAAYVYTRLQHHGYKLSKLHTWAFSLLATFLALSSICGAWVFYIPGRRYDRVENASYAAFHRVFWALAMAWIPVAGGQRAFGIIQPILSKHAYTPLSRLCFGAFLVHGAVQMFTTMTLRTPEWMSFPKLFWMTSGDIMLSFFFAFIIHVFLEAPIGGIQKLIFTQPKNKNGRHLNQLTVNSGATQGETDKNRFLTNENTEYANVVNNLKNEIKEKS